MELPKYVKNFFYKNSVKQNADIFVETDLSKKGILEQNSENNKNTFTLQNVPILQLIQKTISKIILEISKSDNNKKISIKRNKNMTQRLM